MSSLREKNAQVIAAIEEIKRASTADEANWACRNNGFSTFLYCTTSAHAAELNGPLTKIWDDGRALYGSPSLAWPTPHLDQFKGALIDRLLIIYHPEPKWNLDAPLEPQVSEVCDLYYSYPEVLQAMPASFLEKCWNCVREQSHDAIAAATILFNYYRASIYEADLEHLVDMKRLLDSVSGKLQSDIGHAIYSIKNKKMWAIMESRGLTPSQAKKDPLLEIERVYFGNDRNPESCLVGSILLAVFRSLTAEADLHRVRVINLLFGLREAYGFLLAGRPDIAHQTITYCKPRIQELKSCWVSHERDWISQFCNALSIQAREVGEEHLAESMYDTAEFFSVDLLNLCTVTPRFYSDMSGRWRAFLEDETSSLPSEAEVLRARFAKSDDIEAAIGLKRMFEVSFQKGSSVTGAIAFVMRTRSETLLFERMKSKGNEWSLFEDDPLATIEGNFFGDFDDRLSHLHAGMLLSAYRYYQSKAEPTLFLAAIFAIREAYAYYIAGAASSARDSLAWANSVVDTITPDDEREQSIAIGTVLHATAIAARARDEFDDEMELLLRALRFLSPKGTERADTLLDLAMAYERRKMIAEAIASYREVLLVSDVEDETSQLMAKTGLGILRIALESDAKPVVICQGLDEKLGLKGSAWLDFLKRSTIAESEGTPLSTDEQLRGIEFGMVFAKSLLDMNERHAAFGNLMLPIRIGMSIDEPEKYPAPLLAEIFELADSLEAIGDAEDRVVYLRLKSIVEQNPRMKLYRAGRELYKTIPTESPIQKFVREGWRNHGDAV